MEQKVNNTDLELKDRLVAINRVTKVTKGGRTFSFAAIVVVGDENGIVGWGLGKANEVTTAISKGIEAAKKNLIKVPVLKGTIPHEQVARFSGSEVYMQPEIESIIRLILVLPFQIGITVPHQSSRDSGIVQTIGIKLKHRFCLIG